MRSSISILAAGAITVAALSPLSTGASAAPDDEPNPATVATVDAAAASLSDALLVASDVPKSYGVAGSGRVFQGSRGITTDICPTTRRSEAPRAQRWSGSLLSGRAKGKQNSGVAVSSAVWDFGRTLDPASQRKLVRVAHECPRKVIVRKGRTIRVGMKTALRDRFALQRLDVRDSAGEPRRTVRTNAWRIQGDKVVEVSLTRIPTGGKVPRAALKRDGATATRLSSIMTKRLSGAAPVPTPPPTAPQDPTPGDPTPGDPENAPDDTTPVPPAPEPVPDPRTPGERPTGTPWVVSLGDSYISGEGGAWTGNVTTTIFDDLVYRGPSAYFDAPGSAPGGTAEMIERCHRSDTAEIHIGVANSRNFACSGATTGSATSYDGRTKVWKPGVDFGTEQRGTRRGQAQLLQDFASENRVEMVALSIGGNDFDFEKIVEGCIKKFLFSPQIWKSYCSEDNDITKLVSPERVQSRARLIGGAIGNIQQAMKNAGYTTDEWKLVVQNYPSPMPRGDNFRYWQTILRQSDGGCGFWDKDADWANDVVLPRVNDAVARAIRDSGYSNILNLDVSRALVGKRLCENGTDSADRNGGRKDWPWQTRFDRLEWVMQVRALSDWHGEALKQESFHPNALGQLAIRNCLRQVFETKRGGSCVRTGNQRLTPRGEPDMALR